MSPCALRSGHRLLWWCGLAFLLVQVARPADNAAIGELEKKAAAASTAEKSALLVQLSREVEALDATRALDYARRALAASHSPQDRLEAEL